MHKEKLLKILLLADPSQSISILWSKPINKFGSCFARTQIGVKDNYPGCSGAVWNIRFLRKLGFFPITEAGLPSCLGITGKGGSAEGVGVGHGVPGDPPDPAVIIWDLWQCHSSRNTPLGRAVTPYSHPCWLQTHGNGVSSSVLII